MREPSGGRRAARGVRQADRSGSKAAPVAATLVYDTQAQALPVGIRSVGQHARTLLFTADELEVLLQVSPAGAPERLTVMGQMLLEGEPILAADVRLDGSAGRFDERTDEDGEFCLAEVPMGRYSLELASAGRVVQCTPLDLSDRPERTSTSLTRRIESHPK